MALCMGFVSCGEKDDEPETEPTEDLSICTEQEVDLGLPSGTIWAGWNVGASSPEQYGGYYAWGEIETKDNYGLGSYLYYKNGSYVNIGTNISGTKYDVARQKWGGEWRMPTKVEFDELISKCAWTWYEYKGVKGYKITGPNEKSIFLPAAGSYESNDKGENCFYLSASLTTEWSSSLSANHEYGSLAWWLFASAGGWLETYAIGHREVGCPVRPVK